MSCLPQHAMDPVAQVGIGCCSTCGMRPGDDFYHQLFKLNRKGMTPKGISNPQLIFDARLPIPSWTGLHYTDCTRPAFQSAVFKITRRLSYFCLTHCMGASCTDALLQNKNVTGSAKNPCAQSFLHFRTGKACRSKWNVRLHVC